MTFTQRSGEAIVRFASGSYEEVGFFRRGVRDLPHRGARALAGDGLPGAASHRRSRPWEPGDGGPLDRAPAAYVVSGAVLCIAGAYFVGRDAVPLLLGRQYAAVAENLLPLMVTLTMPGRRPLAGWRPWWWTGHAAHRRGRTGTRGLPDRGIPLAVRFGSFGAAVATTPRGHGVCLVSHRESAAQPALRSRAGTPGRLRGGGVSALAFLRDAGR